MLSLIINMDFLANNTTINSKQILILQKAKITKFQISKEVTIIALKRRMISIYIGMMGNKTEKMKK